MFLSTHPERERESAVCGFPQGMNHKWFVEMTKTYFNFFRHLFIRASLFLFLCLLVLLSFSPSSRFPNNHLWGNAKGVSHTLSTTNTSWRLDNVLFRGRVNTMRFIESLSMSFVLVSFVDVFIYSTIKLQNAQIFFVGPSFLALCHHEDKDHISTQHTNHKS